MYSGIPSTAAMIKVLFLSSLQHKRPPTLHQPILLLFKNQSILLVFIFNRTPLAEELDKHEPFAEVAP